MKKVFATLLFMVMTMTLMAVPAKKGIWKTLQLADGTEVRATLVGDEHGHFWKAADGQVYIMRDDVYVAADAQQIVEKAKARRAKVNAQRVQRRTFGHPTQILGKKKAVIILANFNNSTFKASNNNDLYKKIANQPNYNEGNFKGSMADYFKSQSRGKFELEFDVVGPVTVSQNVSYYGKNDSEGNDEHPAEMVIEAVNLAKEEISDWTPYDWDNDGYVDQVYVVYAGKGEADGGAATTIWPHAYDLESAHHYGDGSGRVKVGTNLWVNGYACGGELDGQTGTIAGIGVMCHEYSHCLGYPDFYDIDYSGGQGMGTWDLMDQGSYNGDGFQPAGYTGYERWFAGWEEPVELKAEDVQVRGMKSLQNGGEFYIIYNDKNANEYFLLENRQKEGWDASLSDAGLLILHCDYDVSVWEQNGPNDDPSHQRMTVVPADGEYSYEMYQGTKYFDDAEPFPYGSVNAFNKSFKTKDNIAKKAAQFFTKTSNGTYWMNGSVEDIKQNSNKTIDFNFVANNTGGGSQGGGDNPVTPSVEGALFYESFDKCEGTGGNDGSWSGKVASGAFNTDNEGWTANENKAYGGDKCAKFGTGGKTSVAGTATTPAFALEGSTTMTFKAGAWNASADGTTLEISAEGGTVTPTSVTMLKGAFTDYSVTVVGSGSVKITLAAEKGRFFLDEVLVADPNATGIQTVNSAAPQLKGIYTLDGRFVGHDFTTLNRGLYIVNGKKVAK